MTRADTEIRILDAAIAAYGRLGSRGFSMRAVAAEAGITATAIYRHFADKDALSRAMVDRSRAMLGSCLLDGISGGNSMDRLWSCARSYVRFAADHPNLYRLLFMDPISSVLPDVHEIATTHDAAPFHLVVDRIREAMADGFIAGGVPEETALSVWAHIHGVCALALAGRIPAGDLQAMCTASLQHLYTGLEPRSES